MEWNPPAGQGRPLVLAHRGAMAYCPQNTMPSFELARHMGADGLELDVQLSRDGQLVVFHDDLLDDLTDGRGPVSAHAWKDLEALDAGSHFDPKWKGTSLPLLQEVIDTFGNGMFLNIEIKTPGTEAGPLRKLWTGIRGRRAIGSCIKEQWTARVAPLVEALARALSEGPGGKGPGAFRGVIVSSFDPVALALLHLLMPQVPLAFLIFPGPAIPWDTEGRVEKDLGAVLKAWHPWEKEVDAALMASHTGRDRRVHAWTVNDPDRAVQLAALGVDGIITNVPDLILNRFLAAN